MMTSHIAPPPAMPVPHGAVRHSVAQMLTQSPAFKAMSLADQQDIAKNTALVADYIARPEGIEGDRLPAPTAGTLAPWDQPTTPPIQEASWEDKKAAVDAIGRDEFTADAAREGARVAGELLNQVQFPTFVSGLIKGVFQSITDSSIRQMEAYQKMIAAVATSLHQFMEDNVDERQGRDHMVDQFPDLFEVGFDDFDENPRERLQIREGVDQAEALKRVNNKLEFENGALKSLDLSDENVEKALVENSRLQLARQRQQLMASIVLMGINRIVVTDGRISAKIIYDVKATDSMKKKRSAKAMDVARNADGTAQTVRSGTGTYDRGSTTTGGQPGGTAPPYQPQYGGGSYQYGSGQYAAPPPAQYNTDYYAKGEYQYENEPIITASTSASESSEAAIQTKIQLSGAVDVNFKSDYLPLDKMATPGMIAAIQGNSTPVDPNVVPSPRAAPAAAANTAAPIAAPPATAPAAAPVA